ncbi:hypothetical protein GCM10023147_35860 [Tsukamurella soli]|uniref:Uncharacterized protein n=1 Tax=Tsukamurella soli TaxID=644556 RepID=A0ABP8K0Q9_9ACTN
MTHRSDDPAARPQPVRRPSRLAGSAATRGIPRWAQYSPAATAYVLVASALLGAVVMLVALAVHGTPATHSPAGSSAAAHSTAGLATTSSSTPSSAESATPSSGIGAPSAPASSAPSAGKRPSTTAPVAAPRPAQTTKNVEVPTPRRHAPRAARSSCPPTLHWVYRKSTGTYERIPLPC